MGLRTSSDDEELFLLVNLWLYKIITNIYVSLCPFDFYHFYPFRNLFIQMDDYSVYRQYHKLKHLWSLQLEWNTLQALSSAEQFDYLISLCLLIYKDIFDKSMNFFDINYSRGSNNSPHRRKKLIRDFHSFVWFDDWYWYVSNVVTEGI